MTYDGNGNVSEYLSVSGEVVGHYEYDAFGRVVERRGVISGVLRHGFSTKQRDEETGWSYYGYRYYHPQLGRWTSRDPYFSSDPAHKEGVLSGGLKPSAINTYHLEELMLVNNLKEITILDISKNLFLFLDNSPISSIDQFGLIGPTSPFVYVTVGNKTLVASTGAVGCGLAKRLCASKLTPDTTCDRIFLGGEGEYWGGIFTGWVKYTITCIQPCCSDDLLARCETKNFSGWVTA